MADIANNLLKREVINREIATLNMLKNIAIKEGIELSKVWDYRYSIETDSNDSFPNELPIRLKNTLLNRGIKDLNELKNYSIKEVGKFRNIGKNSLKELEKIMSKHNVYFKK